MIQEAEFHANSLNKFIRAYLSKYFNALYGSKCVRGKKVDLLTSTVPCMGSNLEKAKANRFGCDILMTFYQFSSNFGNANKQVSCQKSGCHVNLLVQLEFCMFGGKSRNYLML